MKKLNIIASAGVLLLVSMQVSAGEIISSVASATTEFKVVSSAEAEVTVNARKDLAAGSIPTNFSLGTWSGSVTAGTMAWRVNRTVNPADASSATSVTYGETSNSNDATKKITFKVTSLLEDTATTQTLNGWSIAEQGKTKISGFIRSTKEQVLLAGRYPIAIEVAAYAF
ncbi:TPA: hypothetical protein ACF2D8_004672 [Serratia marcescens]